MSKILVVEDDSSVAQSIVDLLVFEKHNVEVVVDGKDAIQILEYTGFDLVILDWMLPGLNGVELCRRYRQKEGHAPVLMLTGRGEMSDKEAGLDAGADDYLVKPFHPKELAARVRALLRRPPTFQKELIRLGDLRLNRATHEAFQADRALKLLPKEYELLEFFMLHPGEVFSLQALLANVWRSDADVSTEAVRQCIKRLRKKVCHSDGSEVIKSVFGVGYKLELDKAKAAGVTND